MKSTEAQYTWNDKSLTNIYNHLIHNRKFAVFIIEICAVPKSNLIYTAPYV
jgi:hypothetical protein